MGFCSWRALVFSLVPGQCPKKVFVQQASSNQGKAFGIGSPEQPIVQAVESHPVQSVHILADIVEVEQAFLVLAR